MCVQFTFLSISKANDNRIESIEKFDDVKNVSVKNMPLQKTPKSDNQDKLSGNDVYAYCRYIWNNVYWLASLVIGLGFFNLLLLHHFDLRLQMLCARMRIACCSMIYRKVNFILNSQILCMDLKSELFLKQSLRLSSLAASKTGSGYLVNLMSNDVSRLERGFIYVHYIWILPFQVGLTS